MIMAKFALLFLSAIVLVSVVITQLSFHARACSPSGRAHCDGHSYDLYKCSPPITTSTPAKLTYNDFTNRGGSGPSECDGRFHRNSNRIVALSTGWYNGGTRCGKKIKITASNGRTSLAKVVDECDTKQSCPPCLSIDVVDASGAVWRDLGLDIKLGVVDVTWSMDLI